LGIPEISQQDSSQPLENALAPAAAGEAAQCKKKRDGKKKDWHTTWHTNLLSFSKTAL
jgi:hypothetical protein